VASTPVTLDGLRYHLTMRRWKLGHRLLPLVLTLEVLSLAGVAAILPRLSRLETVRARLERARDTLPSRAVDTAATAAPPSPAAPAPVPPPEPRVQTIPVRRGDTLVRALAREGVERKVSQTIADALRDGGANLRHMHPTHTLAVTWSLDGEPIAVNYVPSPWLGYVAIATDAGWQVRRSETRPDVRIETVAGELDRSLFEAVEATGERAQLAIDLAEMFASEFDFTADTRVGDRFRLLVEKRYAGDTFVDYGHILVAQYVSDATVLTGVGFERAGRWGFYDREGRSLQKTFLKSPLEFTRITSGFTYARPHPILGGVRPHLAIDYAAPAGTPVRAVADGEVVSAGWNGGNGISVLLRHPAGYATMYNHLSRVAAGVRAGAHVVQRAVIGYVGSTGLSTGPHLDYRVAKHGRFVNPLSEPFLPGEPIGATERAEYLVRAREFLARLEDASPF
jgi:murein DD-endopeptidase MepM/ murein hydrolase activator NlpD